MLKTAEFRILFLKEVLASLCFIRNLKLKVKEILLNVAIKAFSKYQYEYNFFNFSDAVFR